MIELMATAFDPAAALSEFTKRLERAGAVVSFTGLVRGKTASDHVRELYLEAYSPLTENGISEIVTAAKKRWCLDDALVIHRTGTMKPAEPIVFVATASAHRREAFEAADFIMDYLKTEAVFWKKETTGSGSEWIEPRSADYQDAARWKQPARSE